MTSRRSFLQGGGKAFAAARLIGTTTAPGMFLADAAQTLGGAAKSVVIPTHEHWGDLEERLDFPAAWDIHVQNMAGHDAHVLTRGEILQRIQAPIGSRPLREIAAGKRSAIVTFDDLTRPTPTYDVAPLVIDELLAAGVPEDRIVFMGSYGTHRNLEADEVVRKLGQNLVRRFAWINHNTWDNLVEVGTTSRKNRVRINQTFAKADLRVTISGIKSHGMAGFGGGAKAVLPGVAALDTVEYNHTTFRGGRPAPGVISLFQNELRLDMVDAARLAKVDFSVQIVYNGRRKVCGIFAGDIVDAHHAACRMAIKHYCTERFPNPDVVISNSYPQSTQAAFAGGEWARTVKAGGSVVLVIEHPQGLSAWHFLDQRTDGRNGRTYLDILASPRRPMPGDNQQIVYSQYIDKQEMNKFPRNTLFAYTWDEVLRHLQARHKGDASVAVYPYAAIQHSQTELDEPKA